MSPGFVDTDMTGALWAERRKGLGIPLEGTLRKHWREAGRLVDSCLYALIRSDFRRLGPTWNRWLRRSADT